MGPAPRRRLAAAAGAAALSLLLLLVAPSLGGGDAAEGSFATPARRPGDRGVYLVTQVPVAGGGQPPEGTELERAFEALAPEAAWDAQGVPFVAQRVRESWLVQGRQDAVHESWTVSLDRGLEPVAAEALEERRVWSGMRCEGVCANVAIGDDGLYRIDTDRSALRFGLDGGLCGLRHAAQGQAVDLARPVRLLGSCPAPEARAIGRTALEGHPDVAVLEARSGAQVTQVWLAAGLPYPVRVWQGWENGTGLAYTLASFEPGAGSHPQPPLQRPLPRPDLAPRGPLGPATAGFAMPFPLPEAIERARSDPAGASLDRYLREHPGAQVAAAAYTERGNGHWVHRAWRVEFAGPQPFAFSVLLGVPEEGEPAAIAPFYSSDPDAALEGELEVEVLEPRPGLAPPHALPELLPTVASLAAVYEAAAPAHMEGRSANAWAFAATCARPDCAQADAWVAAGHLRLNSNQSSLLHEAHVPGQEPVVEAYGWLVGAGPDAGLRFVEQTEQVRGPLRRASAPSGAGEPWSLARAADAWQAPGPWVAAGTGLALAAVAGAMLVQALRQAGVGLFSRIATSELAGQPVRARILAAVAAEPGVHFSGLQRRLGVSAGTAHHHLGKLTQGGLLVAVPHGRHTRYFPPETSAASVSRAKVLAAPGAAQVMEAVRRSPGATVTGLAQALGRSAGTVAHHLDRLEAAGLVERRRDGRRVTLHAVRDGSSAA
jgi:predicted transcriptional regulator